LDEERERGREGGKQGTYHITRAEALLIHDGPLSIDHKAHKITGRGREGGMKNKHDTKRETYHITGAEALLIHD